MTIKVSINDDLKITVPANIDTVFDLFADVPASVSHFPNVANLSDQGDNIFLWEMEKVGLGSHAIQIVYACQYFSDEKAKTITWVPVKGKGNGIVSGSWTLSENDDGTTVEFETSLELTLPLPGLLKLAVSPIVKYEFSSMIDTYIDNLKATFSA